MPGVSGRRSIIIPPARQWVPPTGRRAARDGELQRDGELLRLGEIIGDGVGERFARERDDALVALHPRAGIERDGEIGVAPHQRARAGGCAESCDSGFIRHLGVAAQLAAMRGIDDEQAHRPVAAQLQRDDAFLLQVGREHRGDEEHLAQQMRRRLRVRVAADNAIGHRPQPGGASAHAGAVDQERRYRVGQEISSRSQRPQGREKTEHYTMVEAYNNVTITSAPTARWDARASSRFMSRSTWRSRRGFIPSTCLLTLVFCFSRFFIAGSHNRNPL
ncbi:MAG: hypothetical protein WDN72_01010 [Alphaproteobacteria bacterium]